jgi:hypothetical protein
MYITQKIGLTLRKQKAISLVRYESWQCLGTENSLLSGMYEKLGVFELQESSRCLRITYVNTIFMQFAALSSLLHTYFLFPFQGENDKFLL